MNRWEVNFIWMLSSFRRITGVFDPLSVIGESLKSAMNSLLFKGLVFKAYQIKNVNNNEATNMSRYSKIVSAGLCTKKPCIKLKQGASDPLTD